MLIPSPTASATIKIRQKKVDRRKMASFLFSRFVFALTRSLASSEGCPGIWFMFFSSFPPPLGVWRVSDGCSCCAEGCSINRVLSRYLNVFSVFQELSSLLYLVGLIMSILFSFFRKKFQFCFGIKFFLSPFFPLF